MSEETPSVRRRRILGAATVAATGGLAGCSGVLSGGAGSSDDGGDSNGDDGSAAAGSCTDITNGYAVEDVGERPMVVDFEYPALFDQLQYDTTSSQISVGADTNLSKEGEYLVFLFQQSTRIDSEPSEITDYEDAGFTIVTNFDDEEVLFGGTVSRNPTAGFLEGNLPYEVDGEQHLFRTKIGFSGSSEEDGCNEAMREALEHIAKSLSVNEATTLG